MSTPYALSTPPLHLSKSRVKMPTRSCPSSSDFHVPVSPPSSDTYAYAFAPEIGDDSCTVLVSTSETSVNGADDVPRRPSSPFSTPEGEEEEEEEHNGKETTRDDGPPVK